MHLTNYRTSIILGVTFTLLLSAFWFFPDLAFIIFLSLLLQLLLQPPVDFLQRKRVPRTLAAGLVVIAFIALLTGMIVLLSLSFVPTFRNFVADLPTITLSLQNIPFVSESEFLRSELGDVLEHRSAEILAVLPLGNLRKVHGVRHHHLRDLLSS